VRTASAPILSSRKAELAVNSEAASWRRASFTAQAAGVALAMALTLSACSRATDSGTGATAGGVAPLPCPPAGARVAVSVQGVVRLNGAVVSPAALAAALRSLAPPPVLVCYYRQPAAGETQAAPDVLEAIMSMRLPVLLFEDTDFARGVPLR
jgi:hypothetical protein